MMEIRFMELTVLISQMLRSFKNKEIEKLLLAIRDELNIKPRQNRDIIQLSEFSTHLFQIAAMVVVHFIATKYDYLNRSQKLIIQEWSNFWEINERTLH